MRHLMLGAALALSLATAASAKDNDHAFVEASAVKDKPQFAVDPAKAYILLRSDAAIPLHLIKDLNPANRAAYDSMRADALAKAHKKYAKEQARYESAKALAEKLPKGDPRASVPERPVEPTEANFEFTPAELLTGVSIGPMNRFAKHDGGGSVYLQAVTPGSYRVYGPISVIPNGAVFGTCFCMGSVRFEAKAGEITDMGMVLTKAGGAQPGEDLIPLDFQLRPASTVSMPLDPRLAGVTVRPAAYRPAGKLPNFFGLAIDRLHDLPGVMRYERDRIVDLTASAELASGN